MGRRGDVEELRGRVTSVTGDRAARRTERAPAPELELLSRMRPGVTALAPADALAMQGVLGNRALQRGLRRGAASRAPAIQPKLVVGPATTPHEQEADSFAAQIVRGQPVGTPTPVAPEALQRDAGAGGGELDDGLADRLRASERGGSPLAPDLRARLEPQLGVDLGHVYTHSDGEAAALSGALGARAFTHRNHIYYGAQQRPSDLRLTAHEVVHTLQQGATPSAQGTIQRDPDLSKASGKFKGSDYDKKYTDVNMRAIGVMGPNEDPIGTYGLGPCAALIVACKIKNSSGWVVGLNHFSGTGTNGRPISVQDAYALLLAATQRRAATYGEVERSLKYLIPGTDTMEAHAESISAFEKLEGKFDNDWAGLAASYKEEGGPKSAVSVTIERKGGLFRSNDLKIKYYYD